MDIRDDRELVRRCIDGNTEAWSELVDRFSGLIYWAIKRKLDAYGYAYLMGEVKDIYQRLFASIWEKKSLMNVSERGNIAPWLTVLASNATIDFIRKKRLEENFLRNATDIDSARRDKEADIFLRENSRLIGEAIRLLSDKERAYLEFNYMSGKRHKEIAGIFNTSINSVSTIIARAKNKIRKYVESKN